MKDNLFAWTVRMHTRHRRDFPSFFELPEYRHLNVLRFRTPKETEAWLRELRELQNEKDAESPAVGEESQFVERTVTE
jgi:hypothetical protein